MKDTITKNKHRIFLSTFFFMSGFSFATWASRIPTIKMAFGFNEAELGTVLLAMPIGSLIGLPISGWLVSKYNSRVPLAVGYGLNAVALAMIGFTQNTFSLVAAVVLFAFTTRIFNISVNTQAITLQKQFTQKIIGSFHGFWSTGGIAGVAFSTLLLTYNVSLHMHLLIVAIMSLLITCYSYQFLLKGDRSESGNKIIVGKPDPYILYLGVVVFFAAICEGGMFDWSGIYFQEVLHVKIFTYGYLIFMTFMAASRFLSDLIISKIGMPATYLMSAFFIVSGISLAILFPQFWTAMIGFSLVGFGTAAVVPMSYALAGASSKYSPGMAISIIATYSITGMLLGPPIIGYLAHAFGLRIAFIIFGISGLMLIPISQLFFRHQRSLAGAAENN
ncbi:MFS family permease [Pedobacter cryoconitis]|uniref:MFS family permease n=1 Tax=Pedobacter cryoconitis TaxID=188932 RepID=A0A7W9DY52_9SPHI|nr:MFS transporter [Pedobacter cryoconitis]MBB5634165.1 MFS family permease [Pedobacter cryoconitis]MBB6272714.1 MFS family permease [Pedobacter cryoconitis]